MAGSQVKSPEKLRQIGVGRVNLVGAVRLSDRQIPLLAAAVCHGQSRANNSEKPMRPGRVGQPRSDGLDTCGSGSQEREPEGRQHAGAIELQDVVQRQGNMGERDSRDGIVTSGHRLLLFSAGEQIGDLSAEAWSLLGEGPA